LRGIYPDEINDKVAERLGKALGTFLQGRETVCIGYDTRASSKKIFKSFASGLASTGCEVISLGLVPNPLVYFYSWSKKIFGCLITGSHNPKQWTGLKLVKPNGTSFLEEIETVKKIFEEGNFLKGCGKVIDASILQQYENFLERNFGKLKAKVVVECFGGAGVKAVSILKSLGLEVIALHDKSSATFYGFERPEPKGKNLLQLMRRVKWAKADFGVAFDGDADRAVFVDNKGRELNGSIMSAIFIPAVLQKKKGKIILTADCASELKRIVERYGGELIWWRVGHGFIEKKCLEESALFAGEQSSHFYFNEFYPFSDGILATVYLASILSGKKLSSLVDRVKLHPTEKLYINVKSDEKKGRIVEELKKEFPKAIDIMDGIKIELNKVEWVLIRASQTLPEINICAEGKTKARLKSIVSKYSKIVKEKLMSYG
jgi:phosphomannomutase/phosphoglucomutase